MKHSFEDISKMTPEELRSYYDWLKDHKELNSDGGANNMSHRKGILTKECLASPILLLHCLGTLDIKDSVRKSKFTSVNREILQLTYVEEFQQAWLNFIAYMCETQLEFKEDLSDVSVTSDFNERDGGTLKRAILDVCYMIVSPFNNFEDAIEEFRYESENIELTCAGKYFRQIDITFKNPDKAIYSRKY